MRLTGDLQKSSRINITDFYKKDSVLPLYLKVCELVEDTAVFYTDLDNTLRLKGKEVKLYYKYITNIF